MLKISNGFDNAEQLPFDSLKCSIFHALNVLILKTNRHTLIILYYILLTVHLVTNSW